MRTRAAVCTAAALLLVLLALPAFADVEARAELGYGGRWIVDAATPLRIGLANTGGEPVLVSIRVAQGEGLALSATVHSRVVQIGAGARRDEVFLVPGTQIWSGGVSVTLEVDPTVPIHTPGKSADRGSITFDLAGESAPYAGAQIPYATRVLGIVGDPRNAIVSVLDDPARQEPVASKRLRGLAVPADHLRLAPLGLDGIDTILLCDPDAQTAADPAATQGLLDWVALGGTLAVSLGEHAAEFAASPLAAAMPAAWAGSTRTEYAPILARLGIADPQEGILGPWIALRPGPGAVREEDPPEHAGTPLRAERRLGMGRIVLVAFDLRLAAAYPSIGTPGAEKVLASVVPRAPSVVEPGPGEFGGTDFSGAIARTLQSGAFEAPPLPLVVLGILLYVVVVGPLDWFVLKKLKKERLTTLTFLGAVLSFTFLAYGASLLLFSSGSRVNRIVVADLADAGEGRQALRCMDIAGYYSATGSDQEVAYHTGAAVVLSPGLPGQGMGGDVGSPLPLQVMSGDPLHPKALVQLAFRSQRVVRTAVAGTLGPTIEVEWSGDAASRGVRVVNGLPVDLDDVAVYTSDEAAYELGPVKSGATSGGGRFETFPVRRARESAGLDYYPYAGRGGIGVADRASVRRLLEAMSIGWWSNVAPEARPRGDDAVALRKAGVARSSAFGRGRALLVAHASSFPGKLPGDTTEGDTYVVLRKEVEIP